MSKKSMEITGMERFSRTFYKGGGSKGEIRKVTGTATRPLHNVLSASALARAKCIRDKLEGSHPGNLKSARDALIEASRSCSSKKV
ncbi:MAG: hypothetical protein QXI16_01480 [Sulfolobaceae archaeon]